jgi:hypothetical protein
MTNKLCLCVLFNHPFVENIPVIQKLYGERFSYIRYLVPLKKVNRVDVITVYRGSFSHNGYITDAKQQLDEIDCFAFYNYA